MDNNCAQHCFICETKAVFYCQNLYTTLTKHSDTPIYKFIEKFAGEEFEIDESQILCQECMIKLDDYDLAITTANRVEQELIELLNRKQKSSLPIEIPIKEEEIDVDDDMLISDEFLLVEDQSLPEETQKGITMTCNECCEQFSSVSAMKQHLRKHQLKEEVADEHTTIDERLEDEYSYYLLDNEDQENIKQPQNISTSRRTSITAREEEPSDETSHYVINAEDDKLENVFDDKYYYLVDSDELVETPHPSINEGNSPAKAEAKSKRRKKGITKGPFDCDICKKQFMAKSEYRLHIKTHEEAVRLVCYICGVTYKSKNALEVHYALHRGTSPYQCTDCGKNFTQKGALVRHMPIHTGELPYQCEKCGKQFRHCSSFHMHKLAHDNIREKKCTICGLLLRSNSHLNRHMRVHSGEKPHACPICGQKFAQRYNMMTHYKVHQGITRVTKGYKCPICAMPFQRKFKLEQHLAHVHKNVQNLGEMTGDGDGGIVPKTELQ